MPSLILARAELCKLNRRQGESFEREHEENRHAELVAFSDSTPASSRLGNAVIIRYTEVESWVWLQFVLVSY